MIIREACPQCGAKQYKRNGRIHTGKQNYKCKACGRAFILVPENRVITEEHRALIEQLLLERISLRGICRALGVGLRWLLYFMAECFIAALEHLYVQSMAGAQRVILHRLEAEIDELWSFVGKKANRQWIWIAMDAVTRQIIAFHAGDRSRQSAQALWRKLPTQYQEQAMFYTDCYEVYKGSFPLRNTKPLPSWPVRPITLNASTARCGNESPGWCGRRYRSRRDGPIISVLSSTSFAITTSPDVHPYLDSPTASVRLSPACRLTHDCCLAAVWVCRKVDSNFLLSTIRGVFLSRTIQQMVLFVNFATEPWEEPCRVRALADKERAARVDLFV